MTVCSEKRPRARAGRSRAGFTLLELLLAVAIMAVVSTITYFCFSTVTMAWRKGQDLTDRIHHADLIVEQIEMGLRSAYYPATGVDGAYGMQHTDAGSGRYAEDGLSWVKLGGALVGRHAPYAGGPHRVNVTLEPDDRGRDAIAVRGWGLLSEVEDFEPDEVEAIFLSDDVVGLDYRFQDPEMDMEDAEEIEWLDEWEETNRIPEVVELTVYMKPFEEGGDPLAIKRIVSLPLAPLAWSGKLSVSGGAGARRDDAGSNDAVSVDEPPTAPGAATPSVARPAPKPVRTSTGGGSSSAQPQSSGSGSTASTPAAGVSGGLAPALPPMPLQP